MYCCSKSGYRWRFYVRSLSVKSAEDHGHSEALDLARVILRDVKEAKHVPKPSSKPIRRFMVKPSVFKTVNSTSFTLSCKNVKHTTVSLNEEKNEPARLVHDLNRILYQPLTLHPLKDSRSGVYNFQPDLEVIPPSNLHPKDHYNFVTPYRDSSLFELAERYNQRYVSSTSSMTSMLSHLHYLLSNFRPLNIVDTSISKNFPQKKCNFTKGAQFPSTIILRKLNDNIISLDSDKSLDRDMILSTLGNSLEEFLTDKPHDNHKESYHFSKIDKFILRSQLDAFDSKLPGTGVFDLKTRAVAAIRHDISFVETNNNFTGYEIDKIHGEFESLEREFYDLIRSTLLKYSLQAKIGKMDGIFVAYHNISRMFGFQYLPLDEIEYIIHSNTSQNFQKTSNRRDKTLRRIHGQDEFILRHQRDDRKIVKQLADAEFKMSILLLRNILTHVENSLKSKGLQNWQKMKLMMKTEAVTEFSPELRKNVKVPVLKVVALNLPLKYEDRKLDISGKSSTELIEQIQSVKSENQALLESQLSSIIGFEIKIEHFYKHSPESISVPDFAKPENRILDFGSCQYISKKFSENYYDKFQSFQHPSFFHQRDIDTWKVNCVFTEIENRDRLAKLYTKYLDEKLKSLKDQCVVRESLDHPSNVIRQRIHKLMKNNNVLTRHSGKENESEKNERKPTMFQNQLRAYAMKGKNRREKLDKLSLKDNGASNGKLTWDA